MNKKVCMAVLLMIVVSFRGYGETPPAGPEELFKLKDIFTNTLIRIEDKYVEKSKAEVENYRRSLAELSEGFKLKGDLKGVLSIKEERNVFGGVLGVPGADANGEPAELHELKVKFRSAPAVLEKQKKQEVDDLTAAYVRHLTALERKLTMEGKTYTAVSVHSEITKVIGDAPVPADSGDSDKQRLPPAHRAEEEQGPVAGGTAPGTAVQASGLIAGTLDGTQKVKAVKLAHGQVYVVEGEYFVPEGMLLEIEAGAALRFKAGALLSVGGLFIVRGTPADPVRMAGSENGAGYWKGITISGKEQSSVQGITVTDADVGIYVNNGKASISDSLVRGNNTGIKVNGRDSSTLIENCIIDRNTSHGVDIYFAKVQLNSCTVSENGGFGIWGNYYPQPSLSRTKVTGNAQGGIYGRLYSGIVTAHDSIICGNGDSDVVHLCDGDWDFSRCWWGAENTASLKKSDTANLDCIQDSLDGKGNGRVRVSNFLEAEPADCGARLDGTIRPRQSLPGNAIPSAGSPADKKVKPEGVSLSQLSSKKRIYLSDLPEIRANVGSLQLMKGILNTWEVNGETVGHGLFAHAPSEIIFNIGGLGMRSLKGSVGLGRVNENSKVMFRIYGDNQILWKSKVISQKPGTRQSMTENFSFAISSVRQLRLVVDDMGDRNSDHSIWIDPVLLADGPLSVR